MNANKNKNLFLCTKNHKKILRRLGKSFLRKKFTAILGFRRKSI